MEYLGREGENVISARKQIGSVFFFLSTIAVKCVFLRVESPSRYMKNNFFYFKINEIAYIHLISHVQH